MMDIVWSKDLELGIDIIDAQHQGLFEIVGRLLEMKDHVNKSDNPQAMRNVEDILSDLVRYTEHHFDTEEQLMAKNNYPDLEAHKVTHKVFSDRVSEFQNRFYEKDEDLKVLDELSELTVDWLKAHIMKSDMAIRPYLQSS